MLRDKRFVTILIVVLLAVSAWVNFGDGWMATPEDEPTADSVPEESTVEAAANEVAAPPSPARARRQLPADIPPPTLDALDRDPFLTLEERRVLEAPPPMIIEQPAAIEVAPPPRAEAPPLSLQLVLVSGPLRVAVVNGRQVLEGEQIGEETLLRIDADRIIVGTAESRREIVLQRRKD